jgi:hypothetical protein
VTGAIDGAIVAAPDWAPPPFAQDPDRWMSAHPWLAGVTPQGMYQYQAMNPALIMAGWRQMI